VSAPPDPWTILLCIGLLFAATIFAALFLQFPAKLEIAFVVAALIIGSAIINHGFFAFTGLSITSIIDSKIIRAIDISRRSETEAARRAASGIGEDYFSSQPVATRNANVIVEALKKAGFAEVNGIRPPHPLLPLIGLNMIPPFLPLSSVSDVASKVPNSVTFGCNEGDQREFPIWRTDRYGYNNDDTVYAFPKQILIVGDSYAQGSCVHQEENTAGVLRRNGYPAYSTGVGGFGPILELSTIKEYGEPRQPKAVVWLYFDGNDVLDLSEKELRSTFLLQYLKDDFSQNLINRQSEVDAFWRSGTWSAPLVEFEKRDDLKAEWATKLDENLPLVRGLLGEDISSLRDDENLVRIFTRVIAMADRRIAAWGGQAVFRPRAQHGRLPQRGRVEVPLPGAQRAPQAWDFDHRCRPGGASSGRPIAILPGPRRLGALQRKGLSPHESTDYGPIGPGFPTCESTVGNRFRAASSMIS
jgi:hypothetical protein